MISPSILNDLSMYIRSRWRVSFNAKDIIGRIVSKVFGCCFNLKTINAKEDARKLIFFKKGEMRARKELDVVNLVNRIRQVEFL